MRPLIDCCRRLFAAQGSGACFLAQGGGADGDSPRGHQYDRIPLVENVGQHVGETSKARRYALPVSPAVQKFMTYLSFAQ